ncbi:hypothetical protein GCK72_008439 [Caenorhabditis remanei]|uniref:Uncharacterized protein n=1 Tax=Caenorhabditis remanei TaxID=31234 RepID=A0A6A5H0M3_CAERE|nr:hypothetical protein GCK72_008439 [Caenorhabditis remanei]KAF1760193.1 hypothetical protein GCK72_008439 [Caenorhabditis remanei]
MAREEIYKKRIIEQSLLFRAARAHNTRRRAQQRADFRTPNRQFRRSISTEDSRIVESTMDLNLERSGFQILLMSFEVCRIQIGECWFSEILEKK